MVNKTTQTRIETLAGRYRELARGRGDILREIAAAEIPEMVYNSNAIENSTLTLKDTEDILLRDIVRRDRDIREVYEAKNLSRIMESLLADPSRPLSVPLILEWHKTLLSGINDAWAGRFRSGKEWVRVGAHLGANPEFVPSLMDETVTRYNADADEWFLYRIAWFHAEFETIHPFCDGAWGASSSTSNCCAWAIRPSSSKTRASGPTTTRSSTTTSQRARRTASPVSSRAS